MKMTMTLVTRAAGAALALALCSLPIAGNAQMNTASTIRNFATIDTDHDAKLDKKELAAAATSDFDRLDFDHNGYLETAELENAHHAKLLLPLPGHLATPAAFTAADTDHDEKIDKHEYVATIVKAYSACDANHDGTVELSDLRHCSR